MDVYGQVFIDLWQSLNKRGVRYIMVGGFATNFHGFNRYTGDVDLYIDDTLENRKRLREVFKECFPALFLGYKAQKRELVARKPGD